jgi:hypothetical protein
MHNRLISALICLLSGILFIAVPHKIFPVCAYSVAPAALSAHAEHGPDLSAAPGGGRELSSIPPGGISPARAPMVCFWTARAEGGLGLLVIFAGLLLLFFRSPEGRLGIMLMLAGTAVFGAAIPCAILGVCARESMPCRAGTLPALVLLSGFFCLFSLLNAFWLLKNRKARGHG